VCESYDYCAYHCCDQQTGCYDSGSCPMQRQGVCGFYSKPAAFQKDIGDLILKYAAGCNSESINTAIPGTLEYINDPYWLGLDLCSYYVIYTPPPSAAFTLSDFAPFWPKDVVDACKAITDAIDA